MNRSVGEMYGELIADFDHSHRLQYGKELTVSEEQKKAFLDINPNHNGNLIVGRGS